MKVQNKVVRVPLSKVVIDRTRNVREDQAYTVTALKADLALRGQQDPAVVEKIGDEFFPIKGFLRSTALMELMNEKKIDPQTMKFDEKTGEPVPNTGKPFESIDAIVYEGLTDRERIELLLDHGQRRGLNRVELQNAFERSFGAGYSEKEIAVILYGLLEQLYIPNKTIGTSAEEKLAYYRGVIQTAKEAWRSPTVLHTAWVEKLKGVHAWPTKAELFEMSKLFQKEAESNVTYNKSNPGPKFMERWNAYLKKQADAAADGEKRSKSDSMMNRSQLEDAGKACDSFCLKIHGKIITRELSQDKLALLDKEMVEVEKVMPEEIRQRILALMSETELKKPDESAKV